MSEKYIAKKYVTVGSVIDGTVKCPNCKQLMVSKPNGGGYWVCPNRAECKLFGLPYREVKSLTTIERID